MRKKFKKGFTLVELVVVIAIVAILGAVSTVGYFSFIEKANKSADEQLLTQINTTLKASETLDGKNETMHDAMIDLHESGVKDAELVDAKAKDLDFVWDKNSDRFALVNFNKKEVAFGDKESDITFDNVSNLWKVYDSIKLEDANYSAYLSEDIKINANDSIITNKGLDASSIKNPFKVTHIGNDTADLFVNENVDLCIDIVSNKTLLLNSSKTIEGINVSGNTNKLVLNNTGDLTVFLNGNFKKIDLVKGNLKINDGSQVEEIDVYAKSVEDINLLGSIDNAKNIKKVVTLNNEIKDEIKNSLHLNDSAFSNFSIKDRKLRLNEAGGLEVVYPTDAVDVFYYTVEIQYTYGYVYYMHLGNNEAFGNCSKVDKIQFDMKLTGIVPEKTALCLYAVHPEMQNGNDYVKTFPYNLSFHSDNNEYNSGDIKANIFMYNKGINYNHPDNGGLYVATEACNVHGNFTALNSKITINAFLDNACSCLVDSFVYSNYKR